MGHQPSTPWWLGTAVTPIADTTPAAIGQASPTLKSYRKRNNTTTDSSLVSR